MRIAKFVPARPVNDPTNFSGSMASVVEKMDRVTYDLYMVAGVFYMVRDNCVGVHTVHGSAYIQGEAGKKLAEKLLKEYPRSEPEKK